MKRALATLVSLVIALASASAVLAGPPAGATGHGATVSAVAHAVDAVKGNAHGKAVSAIAKTHGAQVSAAARAKGAAASAAGKAKGAAAGAAGKAKGAAAAASGQATGAAASEPGRLKGAAGQANQP